MGTGRSSWTSATYRECPLRVLSCHVAICESPLTLHIHIIKLISGPDGLRIESYIEYKRQTNDHRYVSNRLLFMFRLQRINDTYPLFGAFLPTNTRKRFVFEFSAMYRALSKVKIARFVFCIRSLQ